MNPKPDTHRRESASVGFLKRLLPAVRRAVIVAGLWFAAAAAEASHFRGASASYTISAAGVVTVDCFSVWRSDAVGGAAFQMRTGPGGGGTLLGTFTTSSTINPYSTGTEFGGGGFTVVRQTFTFNLASPARPSGFYYARWTSCCRVAGINNAPESTWAIELKIAYTAGQASAGPTMIPATIDIIGRGFDYNQNLNSTDPDGTPVAYQFITGAVSPDFGPSSSIPGISLSSIGTVSISAANTASLALGRWVYKVRVTDGSGATAERDVLVAVQDVLGNLPPVLGSIGSKTVPVNTPLAFAVSGTDPNSGQNLTVRAQRIPAGASFPQASAVNSVSSTFNWTPAAGQEGTYLVNFEVFDNATTILIDNELVQLTVTGANNPPVLDPVGNRTVANGSTLTFTISGNDPDAGQTVSFEAFNLPAGATFDPSTRTFTWTPATGQYDATFTGITFRIRDNGTPNLVDDETISLTVGAGNQAPVIALISPQTVVAGQPLQFSVTATDGNAGQTILLTPGSGGLPPGATFPTVSGPSSGLVSSTFDWTPTVAQVGNHTVRFRAEDNGSPILNSELVVSIEVKSLSLDPAFNAGLDSFIRSTSVQPDGKIVIGGFFNTVASVTRNRIARLNADGTLDAGFNPDANSIVLCTAVQADGKIVMGGQFTGVGATTRNRIARINANGTLDTGFDPNADNLVSSVAVQPDGKILIGGYFTTVGGVGRNRIARLHADGTLDASFNPNPNGDVNSVAVQADGKILIGGGFSTVGAIGRNRIARLNADGTLDGAFNPNVLGTVLNVAVQADGKIVIGGQFTTVGGQARNRLARLNADGTLDASFNPDVNGAVISTVLQADGQIVIGGTFTTVGGTARNNIARLRADGTLDPGFNPNANSSVVSVALQADGQVLAGGNFTSIGGGSRNYFARLLNDAASQTLTVPSAARIEWLRGGSTPEATAVSFELSSDGLNWTALGAATRISGGWELIGLGLPSSGSIRARARTTGGQFNGSSGLLEQQAAFSGLPVPEIAVELGVGTDLVDGVASIDFGTVNVGDSFSPPSLTVHSLGTAPLNLTSIETSGGDAGDFAVRLLTLPTPLPATLPAAGGAGTFEVVFQPTAGGPRSTTLRILSNDPDETPFEITLTGIGNANLAPTGIALDVPTVPENQPAATLVGLFTSADPNSGDTHTFALVPGAGDSGNASFTIDGDALKTTASFNHEAQSAYSIRVRATDNGGLSFEQALMVSVLDVNEPPTIGNALPDSITAQYGSGFFYAPAANTFTDVDAGQTLTYSAIGLPPGITFDPATRSFSGVSGQAGEFLITLTATDNGTPNLSAQDSMLFIFAPAPLTVQAGDASRAYGDANPALTGTLTGLKNGDNITAAYSTTATSASPVGTYAIAPALNDPDGKLVNYAVTLNAGTLTVTPAPLLVVAADASRAYGEANPAFTGSLTGVAVGDNITVAYNSSATALSPVGTYAIMPSLSDPDGRLANYAITSNDGTLTVNPAIASVAANPKSKTYGEANLPLDAVVTGEVPGGDAIAYTLDTTATQFSEVGSYPITVTPGSNPNYSVSLIHSTLTVTPAPLQVTIHNPASGLLQTVNTPISFTGSFTLTGNPGAYAANWMISSATVPETAIPATVSGTSVSATIQFPTPGVYLVRLIVEDPAGTVRESDLVENDLLAYVVIYDPDGGFVTGGGWINSPAGAFHPDLQEFAGVTGKATFGFVAKYQKGATVPTGSTEFQFKAGNLNFKSTSYQWLTVAGARAQYKGAGTINGADGFGFMLTAVDGALLGSAQPDRFRMKIWATDTSVVIYDNQSGSDDNSELTDATIIGGGSIVIHKAK